MKCTYTPNPRVAYFLGLDLAQAADYTALAIVEQSAPPDPDQPGRRKPSEYAVRHLQRWRGTSYLTIVAALAEIMNRRPAGADADAPPLLKGSTLGIDATGVGRAVV